MLPEAGEVAEQGIVSTIRRNFGFIACPNRVRDVFFHLSALEDCGPGQLQNGTAVTFVAERDGNGKIVAKRVRLAPVGSRVRLVQISQDTILGHVTDPASSVSKGVIRFINSNDEPQHILFDACDVLPAPSRAAADDATRTPTASMPPAQAKNAPDRTSAQFSPLPSQPPPPIEPSFLPHPQPTPQHPSHPASPQQPLLQGQLVLFHIRIDLRAAQQAQQAAVASATTTASASAPSCTCGAGPASSITTSRARFAYERAVEVRPLLPGMVSELLAPYPHLQRQAVLLELLGEAMRAAQEVRAEAKASQSSS